MAKETYEEFPGVKEEKEERQVDFIVDVDAREKRFKELLVKIYNGSEEICKLESPLSEKSYNYVFLVALYTGKIFSFSTPALKPLVATEHGKQMISTLLETRLKQLAEEADPEAKAREDAAIRKAKEKEQNEK